MKKGGNKRLQDWFDAHGVPKGLFMVVFRFPFFFFCAQLHAVLYEPLCSWIVFVHARSSTNMCMRQQTRSSLAQFIPPPNCCARCHHAREVQHKGSSIVP